MTGAKRSDLTLTSGAGVFLSANWPEVVAARAYPNNTYMSYCCGLFFEDVVDPGDGWGCAGASFVHTGLDSYPWRSGNSSGYRGAGTKVGSLLMQLPNLYNSANVLLPIKPVAVRSSGGVTIIANPKNARYLRIDNVSPGEVISFGADKWKCYPFFKKDIAQRDGVPGITGASHSGTFGYAVRYDGP